MKICYLGGGLGNQIHAYIFARWLEIRGNEPVYLDDRYFGVFSPHNGYELPQVFPQAKIRLWQDSLTPQQWQEVLKRTPTAWNPYPQYWAEQCKQLTFIQEDGLPYHPGKYEEKTQRVTVKSGQFHPQLQDISEENCYFFGIWTNENWLFDPRVYPTLKEELVFAPITEAQNLAYTQKIQASLSVSVHIRRGDFLDVGIFLGCRYYQQALKKIRSHFVETAQETPVFFLFSDHLPWCEEHREDLGFLPEDQLVFVTGNEPGTGTQFRDMQLMSLCKHMILANSTFSLLARYLNSRQSYISPFEPGSNKDWICHLE